MQSDTSKREQHLLLVSAGSTLLLAFIGVAIGLSTGAKSIVFDGVYSLTDAGLTIGAFFAAKLIARGDDRRFQYGYWHIEPLLGFLNGSVLLVACAYALIDGIDTILMGGRDVTFGPGLAYAATNALLCVGIHFELRRRGRGLGSSLLDLDARAWLFSGLLNAGLCVAFVFALALEGTKAEPFAMYVDPAILILLVIALAPLPIRTLLVSGREVLQVAPPELDANISAIAAAVAGRHGFVEHQSYVTRVGRAQFIEIGFVAPSSQTETTIGRLDAIRDEIAIAMGGLRPGTWLTVDFTADRRWL